MNLFLMETWLISPLIIVLAKIKPNQNTTARLNRVQRKSISQPAIWAGCSNHVLAHELFKLAWNTFRKSRIEYSSSVIWVA